ncbi:MAG: glycosyltransferase family 39 protein [Armatimonadota bacterium]
MKKQPVAQFWVAAAVAFITIAAFAFRICGIHWGLPDAFHQFTYHPDEVFQIGAMLRIDPFSFQLDPGFYNYPSGYMNLGALAVHTAPYYGITIDKSLISVYLIARITVVLLGALTVSVVYGAASRLYGRAAGVLAALIMAIIPLHIVHSHFATVDVPAAFWVAVTLLTAAMIITKPALKWYIAAGVASGIAAGTKYNAAVVFIPVLLAHFLREGKVPFLKRIRDSKFWTAGPSFLLGFFISTPAVFIRPGRFVEGFIYELRHAGSGHGLVFQGKGPGWFDILVNSLGYGLGVFLLVVVLAAVALAMVRRKPADWLILSFVVPYYTMISLSEVRFARYMILILPPVAILAGRMIVEVYQVAKDQGTALLRWVWVGICAAVIGHTCIYAISLDRLFLAPDTRTQAAQWFNDNVKPSSTIGLPTVPWFYTPPISPDSTAINHSDRFQGTVDSRYSIKVNPDPGQEWDPSIVSGKMPEYIVMTDFEYEDAGRLRIPSAMKFMDRLNRSYKEVAVFKKDLKAFNISFGSTEHLPHDLKYMSPTIKIYRKI